MSSSRLVPLAAAAGDIVDGQALALRALIAGTRALGREDLRALGHLGIPADYLLGVTDTLVPPGQTRTPDKLAHDLGAEIMRRAFAGLRLTRGLRAAQVLLEGGAKFHAEEVIERAAEKIRNQIEAYAEVEKLGLNVRTALAVVEKFDALRRRSDA